MRFGLIPEFIGRVPVVATLDELDVDALVAILTRPRNALIKQYQKLFDMDGVKLKFTEGSLRGIAEEALERKTGARGLRGILEDIMLDVMYDLPSKENVKECIISEDVVRRTQDPILVYESEESWA
jgi:ATP-dependent Clp protease ATP-binding subunit ClpX